jgi:nitrile hydratase
VRIRDDYPPGHIRTPVYVRGKEGVVTRPFGQFRNPETLAIGRDGRPEKTLYEVRFRQQDLWPDYRGAASDTVLIDIYEHWLERL